MTSQSESESLMNHQLYDQGFRYRVIEAGKKKTEYILRLSRALQSSVTRETDSKGTVRARRI